MIRWQFFTLFALFGILVLVACRPQANVGTSDNINIDVAVEDNALVIGVATLSVTVTDNSGNPINDAKVNVRGDMSHAGMVPVIRDVEEAQEGVYSVPFEWTMGGEWFVDVTVTLPNNEAASRRFEYIITGSTMADMSEATDEASMDHDMAHRGGDSTSAAYMTITNQDNADDALIAVQTSVANTLEIHETTIDENQVAQMRMIERISLPVGQAVRLAPGGTHIMLMNIQEDLVEGDSVELMLVFESGKEIMIEASVRELPPEEDVSIETESVLVENVWIRPATGMSMDMTEEAATDHNNMNMSEATQEATDD